MNIAHIIYGLGLGGIETMLVNISNEQSRLGHKVNVIIINNIVNDNLLAKFSKDVNVNFISRPEGSKNPVYILRLNRVLLKVKPDVIHLHHASIVRGLFRRLFQSKLCVTLHDMCTPVNTEYLPVTGPIFAISDMVKDDIKRYKGLPSTTVYNGVRMSDIKVKESYNDKGRIEIVQVSRLMHTKKGQDILLQAAKILVDKGLRNFHITFIGDGNSKDYLVGLVNELELKDYVTFLGSRDQDYVLSHLYKYDLLVQPSRFEGFGLTIAEGMAAKVPVLVSDNQATMEIIGNGLYGYAFKGGDPKDCADKLERIITNPVDLSMIERAYEFVKQNLSVEMTARNYLRYYKSFVIDRQSK